jgi:hypothetical protein
MPTRRTGKPPPYTEWHGNHYRAKLRIPEELRIYFPIDGSSSSYKTFLYENLRTDDPSQAELAARVFVDRMRRLFARKARGDQAPRGLLSEAARWRNNLPPKDNPLLQDGQPTTGPAINAEELEALGLVQQYTEADALVDRAYELEDRMGSARAMQFFKLASQRTTPIASGMEDWLQSESYSGATCERYRRIVHNLIGWCESNRLSAHIEEINSQRAARFLSRGGDRNEKVIANERAALSRLWDWSNARLMLELKSQSAGLDDWTGDHGPNPWRKGGAHVSSGAHKHRAK